MNKNISKTNFLISNLSCAKASNGVLNLVNELCFAQGAVHGAEKQLHTTCRVETTQNNYT